MNSATLNLCAFNELFPDEEAARVVRARSLAPQSSLPVLWRRQPRLLAQGRATVCQTTWKTGLATT